MSRSFFKHLFYDLLVLVAFLVVVYCLQDTFGISTSPYIFVLVSWILCFLEYWIFEKASPKFQNRCLNILMILFIGGFFSSLDMGIDQALGYSTFCALYIFLIATLKVQNAKKSEETTLSTKRTKRTLARKKGTSHAVIGWKIVAFIWKIIAFIFMCIPYFFLYALQGFMSYAPQLWPLPIVLILSGCVFFMSGKRKYFSFLALCLFSLAIDLSGLTGACTESGYCYGRTSVFSPLLIIFWGLYLAPMAIRSIVGIIKSKKNLVQKSR